MNPLPIGAPGSLRKIKRVAQISISTSIKKCEQRVFLGQRTDFAGCPVNGNRVTTNLSHRGGALRPAKLEEQSASRAPSTRYAGAIRDSAQYFHHSARPDSRTRTRTKRLVSEPDYLFCTNSRNSFNRCLNNSMVSWIGPGVSMSTPAD